jgi:2-polyprenyl-3-methyl-5-hydroxy-6-metoxy-1,4-benzoquinol methylase
MEQLTNAPSLAKQQEYYTDRWNEYGYANQLELTRIAAVFQFMAHIDLPRVPKICDLGCGAGWSTNLLSAFGETTGMDLSDTTTAQLRYPHCRFISGNILDWEGPESEFDLMVSMEVIEHIQSADQTKFLAKARGLLRPGGHLVLTTPNSRTMNAIAGGGRTWSNQPVENWLSATELKELLIKNGFKILSLTSLILGVGTLGSYRLVNSHRVNRYLQSLHLLPLWRRIALWANYGLHTVVLARRVPCSPPGPLR